MRTIRIKHNKLYINRISVHFNYNIQEVIIMDSRVIVLLEIPMGVYETDNVYAVGLDGKIQWQVQSRKELSEEYSKMSVLMPYVGMHIREKDNMLQVNDFSGGRYIFNPENGYIIGRDTMGRDW